MFVLNIITTPRYDVMVLSWLQAYCLHLHLCVCANSGIFTGLEMFCLKLVGDIRAKDKAIPVLNYHTTWKRWA
jgi:hypothetical protein